MATKLDRMKKALMRSNTRLLLSAVMLFQAAAMLLIAFQKEAVNLQALALAVESAKQKAKVLAEAAGVELGEILQINDGANFGYDVNAAYARAEEADAGSGTTVLAAKQSVTANVTITFAIGQ